jgi:hypothetical protein
MAGMQASSLVTISGKNAPSYPVMLHRNWTTMSHFRAILVRWMVALATLLAQEVVGSAASVARLFPWQAIQIYYLGRICLISFILASWSQQACLW